MTLCEALRQILDKYGPNAIKERRLDELLAGTGISCAPGIMMVIRAFSDDGSRSELFGPDSGECGADFIVSAGSVKRELIRKHGFRRSDADYVIDSVTFALGYRDIPPDEPESEDGESLSTVSGAARPAWEHTPEKTRSALECREAAENGDPDAQYWLGVRYRDGIGVSQNYREAWTWLRRSAGQGDVCAAADLGEFMLSGPDRGKADDQAEKWLRLAAEKGNARAEHGLALMYARGLAAGGTDLKKAFGLFLKAAEQGEPDSAFNVGLMYWQGRGVSCDRDEAVRWLRMAAELGSAAAETALGNMYGEGKGVRQDRKEALRHYLRAAEQDCADAEYNLGCMYFEGAGVWRDCRKAMEWFRLAAWHEDAEAMYRLGLVWSDEDWEGHDYSRAEWCFRWAAEEGFREAQYSLAKMYQTRGAWRGMTGRPPGGFRQPLSRAMPVRSIRWGLSASQARESLRTAVRLLSGT